VTEPPAPKQPAPKPPAEWEPHAPEPPAGRSPAAERAPAPEPARSADPFADLPRLRPFTEFELDPIEDVSEPANDAGRRRDSVDQAPNALSGRHAGSDEPVRPTRAGGGRRRHEAADDGDDVLARILAREGTSRG
jgi:hypothetical protein